MLALARQGYDAIPPSGDILEVFAAGNAAEREVWAKGIVRGSSQEYVELRISETIVVAGHLDAWERENGNTIYEVKSQSAAEWRPIRESPLWQRYKFQLGVYMWATGLPLTVIRVKRGKEEGGGIEGEPAREVFEEPPVSLAEVRQRVFQVEMLARRDLTEVKCERVEFPCPFFYTHIGIDREVDDREAVDDPAAVTLAGQYRNAKILAEIANGRVRSSRDALLEYMGERKRLELSDRTLLTRYKVAGKHVEYDRGEYWALRVTTKKGETSGGQKSGDSV